MDVPRNLAGFNALVADMDTVIDERIAIFNGFRDQISEEWASRFDTVHEGLRSQLNGLREALAPFNDRFEHLGTQNSLFYHWDQVYSAYFALWHQSFFANETAIQFMWWIIESVEQQQ